MDMKETQTLASEEITPFSCEWNCRVGIRWSFVGGNVTESDSYGFETPAEVQSFIAGSHHGLGGMNRKLGWNHAGRVVTTVQTDDLLQSVKHFPFHCDSDAIAFRAGLSASYIWDRFEVLHIHH